MSSPLYHPGQFGDIAQEPFAARIWSYLSEPQTLEKLCARADTGTAPIEAIAPELMRRFGVDIDSSRHDPDRVRTMVNNMVKQLLQQRGYAHTGCCILRECAFCNSAGLFRREQS